MEKIFITGANGFIGSNLSKYFINKGFEVYGLVRRTSDLHFIEGLKINLIYGDLNHRDSFDIPRDIDYIIHSASIVSDMASRNRCYHEIYLITVNLINLLLPLNPRVKKFVYISSSITIGFNSLNISEENPGQSAMFLPYAEYKKKTEEYLQEQHKKNKLPLVVLRPSDVYGPNDRTSCALMLQHCDKGLPLIIGHGNWLFGYCYIDNLCQAAYLACMKPGIVGKSYTVTNSVLPTWREFFSAFQKGLNRKQRIYMPVSLGFFIAFIGKVIAKIFPKFEPPVNYYRIKRISTDSTYDISKTIAELGYIPDNDNQNQFKAIVSWYQDEKEKGYFNRPRSKQKP